MITFSTALIVFTPILIIVYLLMLLVADKYGRIHEEKNTTDSKAFKVLQVFAIILPAIGLCLTLLTNFRETIPYYAILMFTFIINIISILKYPSKTILSSFILLHFMLMSGKLPETMISIGEGQQMDRALALNNRWEFQWAHNPSYNPIPTIATISVILSEIVALKWYSSLLQLLVFIAWALAYDLAIYLLTLKLSGDERTALLAVPLIAITPETAIHQHPYQWSGNMLVLLATIMLIYLLHKRSSSLPITITLLFIGAILAHATGIIYLAILIAIYLVNVLIRNLNKTLVKEKPPFTFHKPMKILILFLLLIFFVRALYTSDYADYVLPNFANLYRGLIDLLREAFMPETVTGEAHHIPLYERASVSSIQAYVWSFVISLSTAYIIHSLIKRSLRMLTLALYVCSILLLSISFLGYSIAKITSFYPLNRTVYTFIPLLVPMAAIVLARTIKAGPRKLWGIVALSTILFLLTAPIAAQDPNISPISYAEIREAPPITIGPTEMAKASIIANLVDNSYVNLGNKIIYIYSSETHIEKIVYTGRGGVIEYTFTNPLLKATETYTFINSLPQLKITALREPSSNATSLIKILDFGKESIMLSYGQG